MYTTHHTHINVCACTQHIVHTLSVNVCTIHVCTYIEYQCVYNMCVCMYTTYHTHINVCVCTQHIVHTLSINVCMTHVCTHIECQSTHDMCVYVHNTSYAHICVCMYSQPHMQWHFRKRSLKAQISKLEHLFCNVSVEWDVWALSFEL